MHADPERSALVSRSQLALNLLYEAARHPSITIHFGTSPVSLDLEKKRVGLEMSSKHSDDSMLILEHLMHTQEAVQAGDRDSAEAQAGGSMAESTHEEGAGGTHATTRTAVAEAPTEAHAPGKMMSSVQMSGMQTALALQARQHDSQELPEELGFDLLVGADGALSKVCAWCHSVACLRLLYTFLCTMPQDPTHLRLEHVTQSLVRCSILFTPARLLNKTTSCSKCTPMAIQMLHLGNFPDLAAG
jgi:hypothetical protein